MFEFDSIIIGGGLFGAYAALYLAGKNQKVCIIEKESNLFSKASVINQARLHGGYHYPRSILTATMANEYKERFTSEHINFINNRFDHYYAIDKTTSLTNSAQFEFFCNQVNLPAIPINEHPLFNMNRIEALYRVEENSFDPLMMAEYYTSKLEENKNVHILLHVQIEQVENKKGKWVIDLKNDTNEVQRLSTERVINATYAGTNGINTLFGMKGLDLTFELAEIALLKSPMLQQTGLTVIDGPFASFMPFGLSEFISLSSVKHTPHKVSYSSLPEFDCQQINKNCRPDFISNCNVCFAQPPSNQGKMIQQIKEYLNPDVSLHYVNSLFTLKAKLKSSYIDDARPTEISKLSDVPSYYCLFSGKINSIYEIEKLLDQTF